MGAFSRSKGKRAERSVAVILRELTGWDVKRRVRNLAGESDLEGVPGWSIEVKDCTILAIPQWWRQAVGQAHGEYPVLFYKIPRKGWRAMWPLAAVLGVDAADEWLGEEFACTSTIEAWACVAREVYRPV